MKKCRETESNRRHEDFQSSALPTELSRHIKESIFRSLSTKYKAKQLPSHFFRVNSK